MVSSSSWFFMSTFGTLYILCYILSSQISSLVKIMCQAKFIKIYNCKQSTNCPGFKLLGFSKCTFYFYWTL